MCTFQFELLYSGEKMFASLPNKVNVFFIFLTEENLSNNAICLFPGKMQFSQILLPTRTRLRESRHNHSTDDNA